MAAKATRFKTKNAAMQYARLVEAEGKKAVVSGKSVTVSDKNPRARVGMRLTPVRVKIGRKTYPAKAKRNPKTKRVQIFVTKQVAARVPKRYHKKA
jgi:hypothetical protein